MIPINDIRAWSNIVPWVNDEQIEHYSLFADTGRSWCGI